MEEKMEQIRLNRYISMCGVCSRREADRLIEEGRVQVDGAPGAAGMRISPGQDVRLDGKQITPQEEGHIYVLNKPVGYVCTTDERWHDPLVQDLIQGKGRLFSMGRLDKDSEGLLLMTNRGDLVNKVMKAGTYHEKEYLVTVDRPIDETFLEKMAGGLWIEELQTRTRPCKVKRLGACTFSIILTQGLNRQIRRMCAVCGYKVVRLKRIRIMNIMLGDLKTGDYRELTAAESKELERLAGRAGSQ